MQVQLRGYELDDITEVGRRDDGTGHCMVKN